MISSKLNKLRSQGSGSNNDGSAAGGDTQQIALRHDEIALDGAMGRGNSLEEGQKLLTNSLEMQQSQNSEIGQKSSTLRKHLILDIYDE